MKFYSIKNIAYNFNLIKNYANLLKCAESYFL